MNSSDIDGSLFQSLTLDDTFQTAESASVSEFVTAAGDGSDDDMEIDNSTDETLNFHTPEPDSDIILSSTPFDWKVWANKDFATKNEVRKRDLNKFLRQQNIKPLDDKISADTTMYETAAETTGDMTYEDVTNSTSTSISALSMSILLPTTLGAKFAIGGQKLLMPPPSRDPEGEDLIDIGEDGRLSPIASNVRNISGFSSSSDSSLNFAPEKSAMEPEEYTYNPNNKEYEETSSSSNSSCVSINGRNDNSRGTFNTGSFYNRTPVAPVATFSSYIPQLQPARYPPTFNSPNVFNANHSWNGNTPVQVHHHHYYSSNHIQDILKPSSPYGQPIHSSYTKASRFSPVADVLHPKSLLSLSPNKRSVQEKLQLLQNDNSYSTEEESSIDESVILAAAAQLPAPWKQNSAPHERFSYVLSSYIQLLLNLIATCYGAYLIYGMVQAIRNDIQHKVAAQISHTIAEIDSCRRSYEENMCHPDHIVPALEGHCLAWLRCMNQNPYEGGGRMAMISAEHFGMILNSLIEPLGLKFFMVFGGLVFILYTCNFIFGFFRAKAYYGWENREKELVSQTK